MAFAAGYPGLPAPPGQVVDATVTGTVSGTLYILINITGTAVASAPAVVVTGPTTGQATIAVLPPSVLGPGTHTSTVQVRACINDATCNTGQLQGSPQSIAVTYAIGSATPADAVVPRVVADAVGGEVVLRGSLNGATSIAFGSTPAVSMTTVSSTEVRASYPALAAGTYPVRVNGGSLQFSGALVVVSSPAFSQQTVQYPRAAVRIANVLFDAERNALLVAAAYVGDGGELWRYTYSGNTWSAPTITPVPNIEDIALSLDGSRLFTVTENAILELDPVSLTTLRSVPAPLSPVIGEDVQKKLHYIAIANDGTAIVTSHPDGTVGHSHLFYYFPSVGAFTPGDFVYSHPNGWYPTLAASGDGSRVFIGLGGLSPAPTHLQYRTTTRTISATSSTARQANGQPLAVDRLANRIGIAGVFSAAVYDQDFSQLGEMPGTPLVVNINPSGTRAIALYENNELRNFDITAAAAALPEIGTPISVVAPSAQAGIKTAVTPDGQTVFYGGNGAVTVVPLP